MTRAVHTAFRIVTATRVRRCLSALAVLTTAAWLGWTTLVRVRGFPIERLSIRDASSLTVLDRNGDLLWRAASTVGGRRSWTPLADISPFLVKATLASEDHRFFDHRGVDPIGALRALWLNLRAARIGYGGSTVTMQLVRLLDPARGTRSPGGKFTQALLAARLERAVGKNDILEQYLNRAYYGNGAFGIEAAARLYFATGAATLSPGQAAFLAALPRAPRLYDPYRQPERTRQRQRHILDRMVALGWLAGPARDVARSAPLGLRRQRDSRSAPHFIDHLLATLPVDDLRGSRIVTTLDGRLQERIEIAVTRHLAAIGGRHITQAGVVVLDNRNGDIVAMVGSGDYFDRRADGAVNVTTIRRRPGSTLKPFVYGLALESGDSPASLAYDVVLPGETGESYTADVRQHGFARYRESLAGSYNLAAVHTLKKVGVRALLDRFRAAGLTTLDRPDASYGPDLAIGAADIEVVEYTGVFAAFGNAGRSVRPRSILRIDDPVSSPESGRPPRPRSGFDSSTVRSATVFSPTVAYQIFDILSDPDARRPMFGQSAPMELPFPVALKTGTTRAYTDNLAFGTTREYTVGAWAGNFDGTPTEAVMAMQGAAPLVRAAFVSLAALYGNPTAPQRPDTLVERDVCPLSGRRPGRYCPTRKREIFSAESAHRHDRGETCAFHVRRCGRVTVAFPPELRNWATAQGLEDLTDRCRREPSGESPGPALAIVYPRDGGRFRLDPHRPAAQQIPPFHALPSDQPVRFTIDGVPAPSWRPQPGRHLVRAELGRAHDEIEIFFE